MLPNGTKDTFELVKLDLRTAASAQPAEPAQRRGRPELNVARRVVWVRG